MSKRDDDMRLLGEELLTVAELHAAAGAIEYAKYLQRQGIACRDGIGLMRTYEHILCAAEELL